MGLTRRQQAILKALPHCKARRASWSAVLDNLIRSKGWKHFGTEAPFLAVQDTMKQLEEMGEIDIDERKGTGRPFGYRRSK